MISRQGKARRHKTNKARQGNKTQDKTRENNARPGKTRQEKTRINVRRQEQTRQGKAMEGKERECKARQVKARCYKELSVFQSVAFPSPHFSFLKLIKEALVSRKVAA